LDFLAPCFLLIVMTSMPVSTPNRDALIARLKPHGQEHVLRFWDELGSAGRAQLARQVEGIDLDQIGELFKTAAQLQDWAELSRRAEPPPAIRLVDRRGGGKFTPKDARNRGIEALTAGKVGVLLTAGGQGSRLGFDHPKGMFPIGPVSGASLLQVHFEKAIALGRRHRVRVPVYMMTSPVTHDEQATFIADHRRFGVSADDLLIFTQGTMPAIDAQTGKLLLAEKAALFLSPDGHGGTVAALAASGAIEDMRRRGIEHLFYLQVDNPLVPIGDAEFIGYHLLAESDLTSMAVAKQTPRDRLGNFAMIDGRMHVIEYSDLPNDVAANRDAEGGLVFWAGSIAVHMFSVGFLERALALKDALPFHVARKKVPYIDEAGRLIEPPEANALKFERFIFDLLPHAKNALVVEYAEAEVFAPLKNAPGAERDTPEYVQRFMLAQHRNWLEAAGTRIGKDAKVEISPMWALDAQEVFSRTDRPSRIDEPIYLRERAK
jgi:UDP-N-acetylglucosamine/UDP-N-acetylgalactosamine diphosphorylase